MNASIQPGRGLGTYLTGIRRFRVLKRREELRLARRWREHGDRAAAEALISSHLRLVPFIAKRYRGYGLPLSELVSEGNVGLMRALDRFEPEKGFRFSTYASWWIRSSIQDYVLRSRSAVNAITTPHRRRLFFKLNEAKRKIGSFERNLRSEQVDSIAQLLGVAEQDVLDINGWFGGDASLNSPLSHATEGSTEEWQDVLIDEHEDPESTVARRQETRRRRSLVTSALSVLKERDRRIFEMRWLAEDKATLQQLGDEFGISRERVRQIETETLNKVREEVKKRIEEAEPPPELAR